MSRTDKGRPEDYVKELSEGFPFEGCMMRDSDGTLRPFKDEEKRKLGITSKDLGDVELSAAGYKPYGKPNAPILITYK